MMLQDISFGRLENEYQNMPIAPDDRVICIRDQEILLTKNAQGLPVLPVYRQAEPWVASGQTWSGEPWRYGFRMLGANYFLFMGRSGVSPGDGCFYRNYRQFREWGSRDTCFAGMTGWHIYQWYRSSRFCGSCGSPTVHDGRERMVRCPVCGNTVYPRINPAVIVAVTDGDRLLLSKYAGRGYAHYALIAGFTEIGETLEQTVQREVMEEVGLRVRNIRYYKSQPWGVDGNILMGFFCDLEGDDTIHLDREELSLAQWHIRGAMPIQDDGMTLTREMIGVFDRGEEPRQEGIGNGNSP